MYIGEHTDEYTGERLIAKFTMSNQTVKQATATATATAEASLYSVSSGNHNSNNNNYNISRHIVASVYTSRLNDENARATARPHLPTAAAADFYNLFLNPKVR